MRTWCSGLVGVVGAGKNAMGGGKSMGKGTGKGKTNFGRTGKKARSNNTHIYVHKMQLWGEHKHLAEEQKTRPKGQKTETSEGGDN